jgi:hypothetical protein
VPETRASLLRFSLFYALGKVKLAKHRLSERDRHMCADDVMRELRQYGRWKELDEPIPWTPSGHGDPPRK